MKWDFTPSEEKPGLDRPLCPVVSFQQIAPGMHSTSWVARPSRPGFSAKVPVNRNSADDDLNPFHGGIVGGSAILCNSN